MMAAEVPTDRFDEVRREWIARHQGWWAIQRRRAERLGRVVRRRQRVLTAAVPDPHDDTGLDPLWLRTAKSPASQVEMVLVLVCASLAPLAWPAGWVLRWLLTRLIPQTLRAYPITALLWSGAALTAVTVIFHQCVYDPSGSLAQVAVVPWMCLQLAMIPVVAGLYGIVEGWLAVEGSEQWWPLTPVRQRLTAEDAAAILGGYDTTGPGLVDARPLHEPGVRTRP